MKTKSFLVEDLAALNAVAQEIIEGFGPGVYALEGEMGAGKTTLVVALCKALGVDREQVSSPTFAIINQYQGDKHLINHMDLYRLKTPDELLEIGFEDVVDEADYTFIEWPSKGKGIVVADFMILMRMDDGSGKRLVKISVLNN